MKKIQRKSKIVKSPIKQAKLGVDKTFSTGLSNNGFKWLIGIDEVGRGPIAGPVTLCAFGVPMQDSDFRKSFTEKYPNLKLADSKKMSEKQREETAEALKEGDYRFFIKSKSAKQIDEMGIAVCIKILVADLLETFVKSLGLRDEEIFVLLDGSLKAPDWFNYEVHNKGDSKFAVISGASILAKVHRDNYMKKLSRKDKELGKYGFDIHKGYGTKKHIEAIKKFGQSTEHRTTFLSNI